MELPPGRWIAPIDELDAPLPAVAWATARPVSHPGPTWSALSNISQETGLIPVLLRDSWDEADCFFDRPCDQAEVNRLDAAAILDIRWRAKVSEEDEDDPDWAGRRVPFSRQFPGLAAAECASASAAELHKVLRVLPPARVGLIPARRPADALSVAGWGPLDEYSPVDPFHAVTAAAWMSPVLRSWEDRFGARLLSIGPAAQLLVERPPTTMDAAQRVAAEHYGFADECGIFGGASDVASITKILAGAPVWQFWWE